MKAMLFRPFSYFEFLVVSFNQLSKVPSSINQRFCSNQQTTGVLPSKLILIFHLLLNNLIDKQSFNDL